MGVAVALLLLLGASGCGRRSASQPVFVYCTPGMQPYAALLAGLLHDQVGGGPATVAPLREDDLLTAVTGLKAGDLVICAEGALPDALAARGLARRRYTIGALRLTALARDATTVEDLCRPGVRVGSGTPKGPLGEQVRSCLPATLRDRIEANTIYRSEVSGELLRLLGQGAIAAAFVWAPAKSPAGCRELDLGTAATRPCCPLVAVELTYSRQAADVLDRVRALWTDPEAQTALRGGGIQATPAPGGGR